MMEAAVRWLRPLILPLLRLKLEPPHLPEGSSLVRHLRPSTHWLTYRFLGALLGLATQMAAAVVGVVALLARGGTLETLAAVALLLVELFVVAFTLVTVRLDFELRHYLVGDRSLRVSLGALTRREVTLSYANVQNLEVTQGPLERVFGFKSLTISTAGGDASPARGGNDHLHLVQLVGLEDAEAVRALVMGMLRREKDAGLGEPTAPGEMDLDLLTQVRDAARELLRASGGITGTRFG